VKWVFSVIYIPTVATAPGKKPWDDPGYQQTSPGEKAETSVEGTRERSKGLNLTKLQNPHRVILSDLLFIPPGKC